MVTEKNQEPTDPEFTRGDMNYIIDLNEKLMTCEHVIAGLVIREESQVYITQMTNIQRIIAGWYNAALAEKPQKGGKEESKPEEEPAE